MSNFLAIATVTATLQRMLSEVLVADGLGATATMVRPDTSNASALPNPGVNLYLYQVSPNTAWRNADLPTRDAAGQAMQRPRAALDLHYLFTFHGDEGALAPQRVLGSVVRAMHARPLLTRESIEAAVAASPFLAGSDLAEEVERVKFTPAPFSLEDLSKLWSVMLQTPHALSVVYVGMVALIESEVAARRALPVRVRNVSVFPFRQAVIQKVVSEAGEEEPVGEGSTVLIQGERLGGSVGGVRVGEATLGPAAVRDAEIRVTLTGGGLRAGIQGVQIAYADGTTSNTAPLVLRPRVAQDGSGNYEIAQVSVSGTPFLRVTLGLTVGARQRAVLYLNGLDPTPGTGVAHSLPAAPHGADTDTLDFDLSGVATGAYLVRVEVDGAESTLMTDAATGLYAEPRATVT